MEPEARELADVLEKAVEEMGAAVGTLRDLKNRPRLLAHCTEINRLENVGDQLLRRAVARLFRESPDPIHVIKWKEIYDYLENARSEERREGKSVDQGGRRTRTRKKET